MIGPTDSQNRNAAIGCLAAIAFGVLGSTVMVVAKWSSDHRMAMYPNPCRLCDFHDYTAGAIGLVMVVVFVVCCFIAISRVGFPRR